MTTENSSLEVETLLRLQKMELEMAALREDLAKNTQATQELLVAWQGSKFTVTLAKKAGALGLFILAVIAAWHKAKGEL